MISSSMREDILADYERDAMKYRKILPRLQKLEAVAKAAKDHNYYCCGCCTAHRDELPDLDKALEELEGS